MNLITAPEIPNSVTNMYYTFYGCINLSSNIYILSKNVTNCNSLFRGTEQSKNVYIPFTYENGQYTKTYNAFNNAGYFNGIINGVTIKNLNEI